MKKIVILSIFLASAVFSDSPPAPLKGYVSIDESIRTRLFQSDSNFHIGVYLGGVLSQGGLYDWNGILSYLGVYEIHNTKGNFQNAVPNPLGVTLWNIIFAELSRDVVEICHIGEGSGIVDE